MEELVSSLNSFINSDFDDGISSLEDGYNVTKTTRIDSHMSSSIANLLCDIYRQTISFPSAIKTILSDYCDKFFELFHDCKFVAACVQIAEIAGDLHVELDYDTKASIHFYIFSYNATNNLENQAQLQQKFAQKIVYFENQYIFEILLSQLSSIQTDEKTFLENQLSTLGKEPNNQEYIIKMFDSIQYIANYLQTINHHY
jgi:hypothetical protein